MLKRQKQRCKQPVIALLMNAQQKNLRGRPSNRQLIEQLARDKNKVIQTKSDNNHERKTIAEKKLRSLNLIPKQQCRIEQELDQYQFGNKDTAGKYKNREIQKIQKNKQCLREDTSQSNYGQIVSHYRQSKSRYKNGKQKAKKLIQNMLANSKTNQEQLKIQFKKKIDQVKTHLPNQNPCFQEYGLFDKVLNKCNSSSTSSGFKPKVQKCSTLKLSTSKQEKSTILKQVPHSLSNKSKQLAQPQKQSTKENSNFSISNQKESQRKLSTQKQITTITSISGSQTKSNNQNPLVLKGKHLFTQLGFNDYDKPITQKQIKEETINNCREVSRQMTISRRQTQKLITRVRQKNKKIIGKLKQMKEKRSALRRYEQDQCDLNKSVSRQSKVKEGNYKSNVRLSALRSKIDQSRINKMQSSGNNFLSLNSNVHSGSVIAFHEEIRQKVLIHIQTIKALADYAQSFSNMYLDCTEWEQLIFLLYKKYYIERYKIYGILKQGFSKFKDGSVFKDSPFVFDFCYISLQQLQIFRQSKQQVSVELQLEGDNESVKTALRDLYNKFIQKTQQNESINMYEVDDFSQQILEDLNQQINMLIESCGKSGKIKKRINQAIKVGLMIAHLEGYVLEEIEDIILGQISDRQYFDKYYGKFMEIFADNKEEV